MTASPDPLAGVAGTPSLVPVPDPTSLTTEAVERAVRTERQLTSAQLEVIKQRLDGIDKATTIFQDTLTRVPTDVDKQVGNLKELHAERFKTVELQFKERDTRALRESADAKEALAAALSAAKEAVAEQNKSNSLAISKSEAGTVETINKLSELVDVNIKGLIGQIGDMKDNTNALRQEFLAYQARSTGGHDQRADGRQVMTLILGLIAGLVGIAVLALALYGAVKP